MTLNIECEICQKEVKVIKVRKHIYCSKCLKQNSYIKKSIFHNSILAFKNQKRTIRVGESPSMS